MVADPFLLPNHRVAMRSLGLVDRPLVPPVCGMTPALVQHLAVLGQVEHEVAEPQRGVKEVLPQAREPVAGTQEGGPAPLVDDAHDIVKRRDAPVSDRPSSLSRKVAEAGSSPRLRQWMTISSPSSSTPDRIVPAGQVWARAWDATKTSIADKGAARRIGIARFCLFPREVCQLDSRRSRRVPEPRSVPTESSHGVIPVTSPQHLPQPVISAPSFPGFVWQPNWLSDIRGEGVPLLPRRGKDERRGNAAAPQPGAGRSRRGVGPTDRPRPGSVHSTEQFVFLEKRDYYISIFLLHISSRPGLEAVGRSKSVSAVV